MFPVLVSLGPIQFYSFGTLFIIGLVCFWVLIRYLIYFYRLQPSTFYSAMPWAIVGGMITAHAGFLLTYPERFRAGFWSALFAAHWWTEWALWAGILGAMLGAIIYWLKHNEPVFLWLDILSIAIQPFVFFVSLALFLSPVGLTADALGRPTALPWGVVVDVVDLPFANVPVHPLLLYGVALSLLCFLITWFGRVWARTYVGRLFVIVTAMYSFLWFWWGVVRWYSPRPFWGIDIFWLNAAIYLLVALSCGFYIVHKHAMTQRVKQARGNL